MVLTEMQDIKELVERTGFKPDVLAKKLKVSRGTVFRWKAGTSIPRADKYLKLIALAEKADTKN